MKHILYDVCVYEILTYKYPEIMEGMLRDDFYIIQDNYYDFFYEITYFNSVVGFVTGNFTDDYLICEMAYILPKFRSLGLFSQVLSSLDGLFNEELVLFLPNHYTVLSLIHNNLAIRITDDLVISRYRFCFNNPNGEGKIFSFLYDLRFCCIVSLRESLVSPLLDVDAYSLGVDRCVDMEYFDKVRYILFQLF